MPFSVKKKEKKEIEPVHLACYYWIWRFCIIALQNEPDEIQWGEASYRRARCSAVGVWWELLAVNGGSLQINPTHHRTLVCRVALLSRSASELGGAATVKRRLERRCEPVHAVQTTVPSPAGQILMKHLASDCSWQGASWILHIPVFTKALVV